MGEGLLGSIRPHTRIPNLGCKLMESSQEWFRLQASILGDSYSNLSMNRAGRGPTESDFLVERFQGLGFGFRSISAKIPNSSGVEFGELHSHEPVTLTSGS